VPPSDNPSEQITETLLPQKEWKDTSDIAQIIDTSLLKAYIKTNKDTLVSSLLRLPNHCHVKEVERVLKRHKKFNELVLLYKGKGLHRNALELLKALGQDNNTGLFGPRPTINYLKDLGASQLDLILEFSTWVLASDAQEALEIFVADRKALERLPPERVLNHLKSVAKGSVVPFLEYVIHELEDTTPEFHNELILQYFAQLFYLKRLRHLRILAELLAEQKKANMVKCEPSCLTF